MDDAATDHSIRHFMRYLRDSKIIALWLENQTSPHTRGCYRRDSNRLLGHVRKPLNRISLAATGFCTHAFFLRGRSLAELERLLGYRSGRLASGAAILFLEQLPGPADLQLAGYTYFSGGAVQGHKLNPNDRGSHQMEALLRSEHGWSDDQSVCLNSLVNFLRDFIIRFTPFDDF